MLYTSILTMMIIAFGFSTQARSNPVEEEANVSQEKTVTDSDDQIGEENGENDGSTKKRAKHTAERFVMPVTQWLEKKAHQSKVLNPTSKKAKTSLQREDKMALREAILEAQKRYPGTVLSATRSEGTVASASTDSSTVFTIKILSASGIIKEIRIPSPSPAEEMRQAQPALNHSE